MEKTNRAAAAAWGCLAPDNADKVLSRNVRDLPAMHYDGLFVWWE